MILNLVKYLLGAIIFVYLIKYLNLSEITQGKELVLGSAIFFALLIFKFLKKLTKILNLFTLGLWNFFLNIGMIWLIDFIFDFVKFSLTQLILSSLILTLINFIIWIWE